MKFDLSPDFFTDSSLTMNRFLDAFNILDENDRAHTKMIVVLLEELYGFMNRVSTTYSDSANSMRDIRCELDIVGTLGRFDEHTLREIKTSVQKLSNVVKTYKDENNGINFDIKKSEDKIKEIKRSIEDDKPYFDLIQMFGSETKPTFSDEDTYINKSIKSAYFYFAKFIIETENLFSKRTRRYNNISRSLQTVSLFIKELLKLSIKSHLSFEKALTDIENYTLSVDKLLRCPFSRENNTRIVLLANFMVPETKELQENFLKLREQALENKENLANLLIHINPDSLNNN